MPHRYNRGHYLAHKQEMNEYSQRYQSSHKEQFREYRRRYRQAHKQELLEKSREYHEQHDAIASKQLGQQFLDSVYGNRCFVCGEEVAPEDLARHHINGDGTEERKQLGIPGSWKEAVERPDPTRWATSHDRCHTIFHNHQKVKKSHEPW